DGWAFGVSGAGTYPSQCRGKEARFLFGTASGRGGQRFYHAYSGSRRSGLVLARDDAEVLWQIRQGTKHSIRRAVLIRPDTAQSKRPAQYDNSRAASQPARKRRQ